MRSRFDEQLEKLNADSLQWGHCANKRLPLL